jgi:hypothetical protein
MKRFYHINFLPVLSFVVFFSTGFAQVSENKSAPANKSVSNVSGKSGNDRKISPAVGGSGGYALWFDGLYDYAQAAVFDSATSNVTMECWVYWDGDTTGVMYPTIIYNGNSSTDGYGLYLDDPNTDELTFLAGGIVAVPTGIWLTQRVWTHLALTCDDTNDWKVYVNSTEIDLGSISPWQPTDGFYVGGMLNANNFEGTVDEVRFWKTCLTSTQISDYMNVSLTNCAGTDLICYWQFNEDGGSTAGDSSGNGHDGALRIPYGSGYTDWTTGWVTSTAPISGDVSLPVQAIDFFARSDVGSVTLSWKTQSEVDNAGFNVLRQDLPQAGQAGALSFRLISNYASNSNLKGLGTSSSGRAYEFTDSKVTSGSTYQYKIQSVSTNGTTNDLTTLTVTVDVPKNYALCQNYPNPFNPSTTIRFDLKQTSAVTLEIYNVLGQRVQYWNYGSMDAGRYNESVNMDKFASGVYYYRINVVGNDGQKFTWVKKLVLMK